MRRPVEFALGTARALLGALLLGAAACSRAEPPDQADWQAEGPIQVIDGRTWVVGAHLVTLAPGAIVVGSPAVGALAKLSGKRGPAGQLVARRAEIIAAGQPAPPPVGQPTAQPALRPTEPAAVKPSVKPAVPAPPKPAQAPRRDDDDDEAGEDEEDD